MGVYRGCMVGAMVAAAFWFLVIVMFVVVSGGA